MPNGTAGTNTATATWDNAAYSTPTGSASGDADFAFDTPTTLVDESVEVIDPLDPFSPRTFDYTDASPSSFSYTRTVSGVGGTCNTYDNTATFTTNTTGTTGSASQTVTVCSSLVQLLKLTNGEIVGPRTEDPNGITWNFTLSDASGVLVADTQGMDGIVDFDGYQLLPGKTYTLCEVGIPAAWANEWQVDTTGDGIPDMIIPFAPATDWSAVGEHGFSNVYDPNYVAPPQTYVNDTRCVNFVVEAGETLNFQIDNKYPGGDPRTIGFWKNWNTCSGGNQYITAEENGGPDAGWYILDDLLNWPGITIGTYTFDPYECKGAVNLLDKSDRLTAEKKANDAAFDLAAQLMGALLNLSAGAEICPEVTTAVDAAQELLFSIGFDGTGDYLRPGGQDKSLYNYAIDLSKTLDTYNNGLLCGDDVEPPPPGTIEGYLHVEAMEDFSANLKGGRWEAVVQITIWDQDGVPVEGVLVNGSWSSGAAGSGSCTTDENGQCKISKNIKAGVTSVTFTIMDAANDGWIYDPGGFLSGVPNVVTEFTVDKPEATLPYIRRVR
jgi:hypothetical protein